MPRTNVTVDTADGACAATLHTPSGADSAPGVIIYPDAAGVRETFLGMADRVAALGYTVLLPEIYYREAYAPFDTARLFAEPGEFDRLRALAALLTTEMTVRDADAFLKFLAGRPEVSGTAVGVTGYCAGGRMALLAAAHFPDRVGAAASVHGGRLAADDDPDSPYLLADRIRGTVLVAAAENDPSFPAEQYARLEAAFAGAGLRHTIETYPASHGFAVPDMPPYDAAADERHWAALADLFAGALRD